MASKRQKKKQAQQKQQKLVQSYGYDLKQYNKQSTEQKAKIVKTVEGKEKRKKALEKSYRERQRYIDENKLQGVKKNASWKTLRRKFFEQLGYEKDDIPDEWLDSKYQPKKSKEDTDIGLHTAEHWLYLGWHDTSGNYDVDFDYYMELSVNECKKLISELLKNIHTKGSSGKAGHYIMQRGSKESIEDAIPFYEIDGKYHTIAFSNQWTVKGLYQITGMLMDNIPEIQRPELWTGVKKYVKRNLPQIYKYFGE